MDTDCFLKVGQLAMELHLPPIHQQNRHSPLIVHPKLEFQLFSRRSTVFPFLATLVALHFTPVSK